MVEKGEGERGYKSVLRTEKNVCFIMFLHRILCCKSDLAFAKAEKRERYTKTQRKVVKCRYIGNGSPTKFYSWIRARQHADKTRLPYHTKSDKRFSDMGYGLNMGWNGTRDMKNAAPLRGGWSRATPLPNTDRTATHLRNLFDESLRCCSFFFQDFVFPRKL